jgi:GT2 family glycosyltransferase
LTWTDAALGLLAAVVAGCALFWTAAGLRLFTFRHHFPFLPRIPADEPPGGWPRVTLIVPARNEERTLEPAVRALLHLDYPALEVVALDDRSTDATGRLLDGIATEDRRLRVVHLDALPEGWLGKNNAMAEGARAATGEWLLFTDADVVFAPDALKRAMVFALRHGLGHVVAFPHLVAPGFFERAFVTAFAVFGTLKFRVWDLPRAGTSAYVGVGAFNLVRRAEYDRVGGHDALRMEVLDDMKLGLVLRRSGVPQGACDSGGLVRVRWQDGFRASVGGLVKNAFAGPEWSVGFAFVAFLAIALLTTGPLLVALLHPWPLARWLGALGTLAPCVLQAGLARRAAGGSGLEGLTFPLCGLLLSGVVLYSTLAAVVRGGIVWRGTFYSLEALRRGYVRRSAYPREGAVGWPKR